MDFNYQVINDGIDALGCAGSSIGKVATAANAIKSLIKTPKTAREVELKSLVADLTSEIADAKLANADLKIRLAGVVVELNRAKESREKFENYTLIFLIGGDIIYEYQPLENDTKPQHCICAFCRDNSKLSFLKKDKGGYWCHFCQLHFGETLDGGTHTRL